MTDAKYAFSELQVITANATTVDSTNQVDLGDLEDHRGTDIADSRAYGPAFGDIRLIVTVGVAADVAGNLTVALHDATATGGSFAAVVPAIASPATAQATLVAGYTLLNIVLPRTLRRALKLVYTTSADWSSSTCAMNAYLRFGQQMNDNV